MNTRLSLVAILASSTLAPVFACGPNVDDGPRLYERRRSACEPRCELLLDPECGAADAFVFDDVEGCTEICMSEEFTSWALQEDGSDACFDEVVAHFDCVHEATCEEQRNSIVSPGSHTEHPCGPALDALFACNDEHIER